MKEYEGLFILKPTLNKDEMEKVSSAIVDVMVKNGGKVESKEEMGLRKLAYEIKKANQGYYLLTRFMAQPKAISDIAKSYKLNESILRAVIFKRDIAGATLQAQRVRSADLQGQPDVSRPV